MAAIPDSIGAILKYQDDIQRQAVSEAARAVAAARAQDWERFALRAAGSRAMLPHVDAFCAGHNIASLKALAGALSRPEDAGEKARLKALLQGSHWLAPIRPGRGGAAPSHFWTIRRQTDR